jgi:hypothetical protein
VKRVTEVEKTEAKSIRKRVKAEKKACKSREAGR